MQNPWNQNNAFVKAYTIAVRVGYDPQAVINTLKGRINAQLQQNLRIKDG